MSNIEEVKEKFESLQKINQSLKEEKIRVESEIETLKNTYNEKLDLLLKETGTNTLEEAVEYCTKEKEKLDKEISELDSKISQYLDSYGDESDE